MGLKNCPECGRVFVENPAGMCPACLEQEERDEIKVVDFLRDSGKASIEEIHLATGVKEKTILRMMKKGRFIGDFVISYPCETCGTLITEGRVCLACSKNITSQLRNEAAQDAETVAKIEEFKKVGRMYTNLNKNK
ncbi:hypothetical protein P22_0507 [Propionispora sp. 2/2-37]|uniref:flagellar protein n=1 Tax=Propionispora sp. 2/2-37 TaxID=1677858 RepID=UPI0006BB59C6|nr:flagellar protein [Propionispora sp. 2/2-37]CUH94441.1 hypothetical protein P22_0507 [Propionispora sp. 2/2-37]